MSQLVSEVTERIILAVVMVAALSANAFAKAEKEYSYAFERVWPAAIRLLHVDEKFTIVEKDVEAGYVLFALKSDGKEFQGSMELVRTKDSRERDATRVLVAIPGRPDYVGDTILNKLGTKLFDELGDPPSPPPKKAPPEAPNDPPPADEKPKDDKPPAK